ncbi:phage major capsid protein [Devosia sp. A449]
MTFNPHATPGAFEIKEADQVDLVTKALADLTKTVDDRIAAIETKSANVDLGAVNTRLDQMQAALNRPVAGNVVIDTDLEQKAFQSFARHGVERMPADEVKGLTVSTDSAGGYLVPDQFLTELDKNLVLYSPIRSVARVAPASAGEIILPKRTGTLTGAWVGETTARAATQPTYGQQTFVMHEIACYVDVSNRLLEDSAFNVEGELAHDFGEEFGRIESAAFVGGDGTGKPTGMLLNTDVEDLETAGVNIAADDLIDLFHGLASFYAANGTWAMNRQTLGKIRKLKDVDGNYLWQAGLVAGNPGTILGRPVVEFPDMPDAAAGEIPVAFGDFHQGFRIFDRTAVSILRDPYTVQTTGQVRFHARRRVGGAVSKAEALKFLTVKV